MMKRAVTLTVFFVLFAGLASGWELRKWEFINPRDLEVTIRPDRTEIFAGETATFTISIRNRTDKPLKVPFPTGQRWDLAVFHGSTQIYRWSQGCTWDDTPHSLEIPARQTEQMKLGWQTVDRQGVKLPQGIYRVQGMVMTRPRHLVSNLTDIRLLPPRDLQKGDIKVRLGETFELELPRYEGKRELHWTFQWEYNDNRLFFVSQMRTLQSVLMTFRAERRGHVVLHLFGYPIYRHVPESVERQTYRIAILGSE